MLFFIFLLTLRRVPLNYTLNTMFKKVFFGILLLLATMILLLGCKENNNQKPTLPLANNRTVVVYMLADNNLDYSYNYDDSNIEAMCRSFEGKSINGRLLIFHAGSNMQPCLKEIYKPNVNKPCEIKVLKTYHNSVSTDSATVRQVLNDAQRLAPSSSYGLVLWSHATGWLPQNRLYTRNRTASPTSFGREGNEERTIDIDILARAIDTFHFDFILFDACLMGCVEIAYEMRNICDYIIATPTETVGEGFPYKHITPLLFDKDVDYTAICQYYYNQISSPDYFGGTVSLISTQYLEQLANICQSIVNDKTNEIINLNTRRIQYYDRSSTHVFYDLGHYIYTLGGDETYPLVEEALSKAVVYKAATPAFLNIPISHFSGMSCYIPYSSNDEVIEEYYSRLQWYKRLYDNNLFSN